MLAKSNSNHEDDGLRPPQPPQLPFKTRPTPKQQPLADPIHNDKAQRTRLLLKALGNHEAFCPQRDAVRPESKRPPILNEPATPYQPIDASKSW